MNYEETMETRLVTDEQHVGGGEHDQGENDPMTAMTGGRRRRRRSTRKHKRSSHKRRGSRKHRRSSRKRGGKKYGGKRGGMGCGSHKRRSKSHKRRSKSPKRRGSRRSRR